MWDASISVSPTGVISCQVKSYHGFIRLGIQAFFAGHGFHGNILILDDLEYFLWVY